MNTEFPRQSFAERKIAKLRHDVRVIRICATAVLVIALLAAGVAAGQLLAPTAIAATLALVLAPVCRTLERFRIPTGIAAVLTVVATVACLTASASALAPQVTSWLNQAPAIARSIERKLQPLARRLAPFERVSSQISSPGTQPAAATPVTAVALPNGFILEAAP